MKPSENRTLLLTGRQSRHRARNGQGAFQMQGGAFSVLLPSTPFSDKCPWPMGEENHISGGSGPTRRP